MNRAELARVCLDRPQNVLDSKSELRSEIQTLLAAAVRAPSGDNMQPWYFMADLERACIDVCCDTTRDGSPMNSGQRMSYIACGAAIENVMLLASERGWYTELESPKGSVDAHAIAPLLARIHLVERIANRSGRHMAKIMAARVANRRRYDARQVPIEVLDSLKYSTPALGRARLNWITDREAIGTLAAFVAQGDATMFGEPSMRNAFLANIRFDLPPNVEAEDGLPLATLEVSAADRLAMSAIRFVPNSVFRLSGARRIFATHARGLIQSSSGLCIVSADDASSRVELDIGRTMQSAWLAMTERELAVQPMMSLLVLDNALRHGTPELRAALQSKGAQTLVDEFHSALRSLGISGRPGFLLRFGYSPPPSGRTGRMKCQFDVRTVKEGAA